MSGTEKHSPLQQFELKTLFDINIGGISLDFTNSALFMMLSSIFAAIILIMATKNRNIIPSRFQVFAEFLYSFVKDILVSNTGKEGLKFFALSIFYLFSLFSALVIDHLIKIWKIEEKKI